MLKGSGTSVTVCQIFGAVRHKGRQAVASCVARQGFTLGALSLGGCCMGCCWCWLECNAGCIAYLFSQSDHLVENECATQLNNGCCSL